MIIIKFKIWYMHAGWVCQFVYKCIKNQKPKTKNQKPKNFTMPNPWPLNIYKVRIRMCFSYFSYAYY